MVTVNDNRDEPPNDPPRWVRSATFWMRAIESSILLVIGLGVALIIAYYIARELAVRNRLPLTPPETSVMSTKLAAEERALSRHSLARRDSLTWWPWVQQFVLVLVLLGLMCGATVIVVRHLMER